MAEPNTNSLWRELTRACAVSIGDWKLFAIAVGELAFARFRHAIMPAAKIIAELRDSRAQMINPYSPAPDLARLSWALAAAARRVPWRADCLLQAMAAKRWLQRHGIESEFFVGVDKDTEGALLSHAWLVIGERVVTGPGHERFHVMIGPR